MNRFWNLILCGTAAGIMTLTGCVSNEVYREAKADAVQARVAFQDARKQQLVLEQQLAALKEISALKQENLERENANLMQQLSTSIPAMVVIRNLERNPGNLAVLSVQKYLDSLSLPEKPSCADVAQYLASLQLIMEHDRSGLNRSRLLSKLLICRPAVSGMAKDPELQYLFKWFQQMEQDLQLEKASSLPEQKILKL